MFFGDAENILDLLDTFRPEAIGGCPQGMTKVFELCEVVEGERHSSFNASDKPPDSIVKRIAFGR
jgi:hypothetical protein